MEKKLQNPYLTDYSLLVVQDFWPTYYRILLIILLKDINMRYEQDDEKCDTGGMKYKDCDCCLEYINVKDDLIKYKCIYCNKNCQKMFNGNLKKQLFNTYKFSNRDINKSILLLQKGV